MDDKIVKSIELCDTQWRAESVSVNSGTVCIAYHHHATLLCGLLFCFQKPGKVLMSRHRLTAHLVQSSHKQ